MNNENKAPVRKIKFRGLRVDGKGWVYGDLKRSTDNRRGGTWHYIWVDTDDIEEDGEYIQVLPHTIGQFTGLLDKNGKEIYEGDKLQTEKLGFAYVVWDDAAFAMKSPGSEAIDWVHSSEYTKSEVIGNIHENKKEG